MPNLLRPAALVTLLLVAATDAAAQDDPSPYEFRGAFLFGSKPIPPRTSCGDYWCISWGAELSLSRSLSRSFALVAGVATLSPMPDSMWLVAIPPSETGFRVRYYGAGFAGKRRVTSDVRFRFVPGGGRGRGEIAAGGGRTLAPHNMPYGVIAAGIRFGDDRRFLLGAEHRSYWMRYTQSESVSTPSGPTEPTFSEGKTRASTRALVFSVRF